jgi:hypothetical protein
MYAKYAEEVIELAKKNAGEMKLAGESLRRIQFGQESGFFYLSDDPDELISDKNIEVEGIKYYLGIYKKKRD